MCTFLSPLVAFVSSVENAPHQWHCTKRIHFPGAHGSPKAPVSLLFTVSGHLPVHPPRQPGHDGVNQTGALSDLWAQGKWIFLRQCH